MAPTQDDVSVGKHLERPLGVLAIGLASNLLATVTTKLALWAARPYWVEDEFRFWYLPSASQGAWLTAELVAAGGLAMLAARIRGNGRRLVQGATLATCVLTLIRSYQLFALVASEPLPWTATWRAGAVLDNVRLVASTVLIAFVLRNVTRIHRGMSDRLLAAAIVLAVAKPVILAFTLSLPVDSSFMAIARWSQEFALVVAQALLVALGLIARRSSVNPMVRS